jgi:type I restriction enzyme S subunit
MTGAVGLRRVPKNYLAEQKIPLPPLPDQRRIVAEIEKQFTRLAAGVSALKRVQANLKRYRATVLKAACEGCLTNEKIDQWRNLTFEDVCAKITDGDHQPPPQVPEGIPFLTIGNISSGKLDFSNTRFVPAGYYKNIKPDRLPKNGDILYTVVGASIGIPVIVNTTKKFCFQRHIALLKPSDAILSKFLWIVMAQADTYRTAWKWVTGSAQPTLPLKALRSLPILLPTIAEQTRIVAKVERCLSVIDKLETLVTANLARANHLRYSILQRSFK